MHFSAAFLTLYALAFSSQAAAALVEPGDQMSFTLIGKNGPSKYTLKRGKNGIQKTEHHEKFTKATENNATITSLMVANKIKIWEGMKPEDIEERVQAFKKSAEFAEKHNTKLLEQQRTENKR